MSRAVYEALILLLELHREELANTRHQMWLEGCPEVDKQIAEVDKLLEKLYGEKE